MQGRSSGSRHLQNPKVAHARVAEWLAEIAGTTDGQALAGVADEHPRFAGLTAGLAESAPHLWELLQGDASRAVRVSTRNPSQHLDALLAEASRAIAASDDETSVMSHLRALKAEASLLIALCDIGGVWPIMRLTQALTRLADCAVESAVRFLLADGVRRGLIMPVDPGRPEFGSGYIVLAMGKMGAGELNYSSDIDLIVFFDAAAPVRNVEPGPFFVRMTQRLVKLLQERTPDGYVFRTDLRLRPDPSSTPLAVSTAAALGYYERRGQDWERAALIKARACAGDIAAGEALLTSLASFIWRKYLDFGAIADIHAMKRQIHAYRGHGEIAVEGHNIKLGRGGIREIEFFVQTQQLVAGGRHPELRERQTLAMLRALAEGGWIDPEARDELSEAYRFLRSVEHRLQMVADEQTHTLPADREGLERFAHFFGARDRDTFAETLVDHLRRVQRHYAALFESAPAAEANARALVFPPDADDRETLEKLCGSRLSTAA